jgi:putative transposase
MPRKCRYAPTGVCSHVINRGNDKRKIFQKDRDYELFIELLIAAKKRAAVSVFGLCAMPNHFHLVVRPDVDGALSTYMQWATGSYAIDYRVRTDTVGHGHVFQRRFWNATASDARHFLAVMRYVEANPVRAALVQSAEEWKWSSMSLRRDASNGLLDEPPVALPEDWLAIVDAPQSGAELEILRDPVSAARALGSKTDCFK